MIKILKIFKSSNLDIVSDLEFRASSLLIRWVVTIFVTGVKAKGQEAKKPKVSMMQSFGLEFCHNFYLLTATTWFLTTNCFSAVSLSVFIAQIVCIHDYDHTI